MALNASLGPCDLDPRSRCTRTAFSFAVSFLEYPLELVSISMYSISFDRFLYTQCANAYVLCRQARARAGRTFPVPHQLSSNYLCILLLQFAKEALAMTGITTVDHRVSHGGMTRTTSRIQDRALSGDPRL
jgi:hypothetical protein